MMQDALAETVPLLQNAPEQEDSATVPVLSTAEIGSCALVPLHALSSRRRVHLVNTKVHVGVAHVSASIQPLQSGHT